MRDTFARGIKCIVPARQICHGPSRDDPRLFGGNHGHDLIILREEVSITRIQHWQDVAGLLLGVWLILSPFALGSAGAATWITIVLGLCAILFAVEGFVIPSYLEEWGEVLLGLALLVAPWAIGYESVSATVSSMVSGMLVILLGT
ncbi:SPW repeat domain-containing protein [Nitrobacter sp. JJSN]|uniref:SPW repeat domain-containing protein n=1 Tax=Nitrobacter sp. JJSN TaxID=3453033 RepID=UPI003F777C0C